MLCKNEISAIVVTVLIVLVSAGSVIATCSDDQIIMKLHSPSNSHGAIWNDSNYEYEVCYSDIFGEEYLGENSHDCIVTNTLFYLSSQTNAHASATQDTIYSTPICYGDLACSVINEDEGESCSGVVVASLYSLYNSHISDASDDNYPYKLCCSEIQVIQWQNLRSQLITEADKGDYVKMIMTQSGLADGTRVAFEVYEKDGGLLNPDDAIRTGAEAINGTVINGNAVGYWKITSADLAKTNDLDNFVFRIAGKESGELVIDPNEHDDPTDFRIVSPTCGSNYTIGNTLQVEVVAEDSDDILSGNLSFEAEGIARIEFTNGGIIFSEVLNSAGNSQVVVTVSNTRGKMMRKISSIMVVDETKDGSYIAACIDKPADFSDVGSGDVLFLANSSRGLRYTVADKYSEVPKSQLNFFWAFSDGRTNPNTDGANPRSYDFHKTFIEAGHNGATLEVEFLK